MINFNDETTRMLALIKYSTKKALFSRKVVISVLITIFVSGIMGYAATKDLARLDGGADFLDVLVLFFFAPVIAMMYGTTMVRDEIEDRSITQVLASPMHRVQAYFGYYASLLITMFTVTLVLITCGFLAFFGQKGIDAEALNIYASFCGLVIIGSIAYSSLFLALSVLTDKAVYIGLFYAFIWEGLLGSLPGRIHEVAIKHYVRSIGADWINHGGIVSYQASGVLYSFGILAGLTVTLLALGAFVFWDKEFP